MGDYVSVDMSDDPSRRGRVFEIAEGFLPTAIHSSIERLFQTYAVAANAGALFVDDMGLQADFEKFSEVARSLNPDIEFWKD